MRRDSRLRQSTLKFLLVFAVFAAFGFARTESYALNIKVAGPAGEAVTGFRWTIEEDATYHPETDPNLLALNFHKSYMPVSVTGNETSASGIALDGTKYYYVSVLPDAGYTMGGAQVKPGQTDVTVYVTKLPLPTAQISVFIFDDSAPINGAPDIPEEPGLAGFKIVLYEAGGRYGMSGGQVTQDAFGNPLGTTYNADGSVAMMGNGVITSDATGMTLIKNLAPGKYTLQAVPPAGQGWVQTSTIEGTKGIDAWVKANEPIYFMEFGPPGWHVFIGFTKPQVDATVLKGGVTLQGTVVNNRLSRPPDYAFYNGGPYEHTTPWVGLNDLSVGIGKSVYAQRANPDGSFSIPNVPPGNYRLVVWDDNLDLIIAFYGVTVNPDGSCKTLSGSCNFGDVPVFNWFTGLHNYVFYDMDENGMMDPGEMGIPEQAVNLRFRDGSLYQSMPTDTTGFVPFDETFPFFNWLVAEVDYARFKPTGATIITDGGGPIDPTDPNYMWSFDGLLNPQIQPDGLPYRVETGPVLTEAFQGFLGQTSVIQWGKTAYKPGENGGISGLVYYATTRAEHDPRYAVPETWEPGIPRVQVNLYADANMDGIIDDTNGDTMVELADVDNYPFKDTTDFPGPGDVDRNGNGQFDLGDALQSVTTDSWDDNLPADCPGDPTDIFYMGGKCYDGMRVWNQVRPGVFDGGYAFDGLLTGTYIVEAVPPTGYNLVKEEDKNVDFGDTFFPVLLPPICVGDAHTVPSQLSLFPGIPAPYANQVRPLCDRKQVALMDGRNAAADFFMFTDVPVSGHITGMILDDTANEFDPNSPQFGEKFAPSNVPVAIRDWTGKEIGRVYSDQWGRYNALVPSTYSVNLPMPSGVSPNMITTCMNDPGPIFDEATQKWIMDPNYNSMYSQFCYTFNYMPGTTTYLDTPVVRVAAFAGPGQFPLDCEFTDGTPRIASVSGPEGGPYVPAVGQQIAIDSVGTLAVPNPAYDGPGGLNPLTILRDFGFGAQGANSTVSIGTMPLTIVSWNTDQIIATVPTGTLTGQLKVTRDDTGGSNISGVTVTVGPISGTVRHVPAGGSIQTVIDAAFPGDLVLVPPGRYEELVIMWKPVYLQGSGEGTIISAVKVPAEKLQAWRNRVEALITGNLVDLLPGQEAIFGGIEPVALFKEEGPGIIVLSKDASTSKGGFGLVGGKPNSRIDGFTITGADHAGGIVVNGYAHYLEISNNRLTGNTGFYGGGIRVGHPFLTEESANDHIRIHNNQIVKNGGLGGAGGGLSLHTGAELYEVSKNFICGNFTLGEGGGIGHLGHSDGGVISNNIVLFNHSFNQGTTVSGGGIFIGGFVPVGVGALTEGSGNVKIISNLIQGNLAGAGDGGGIRTSMVNGDDANKGIKNWFKVEIYDNMIVDNVAALAGGGISLQDTLMAVISHNTIANNDSTATAGEAFAPGNPSQSIAQPAGVVSRAHSAALKAAINPNKALDPYRTFSNPTLVNNVIWHNRSFYFLVDTAQDPTAYLLIPDVAAGSAPLFWDLGVTGTAVPSQLSPAYCLLTDTTGYAATNRTGDPMFVSEYFNGSRGALVMPEVTTAITPAPAFDEGGNFIDLHFGPLTFMGDYHVTGGSAAAAGGDAVILSTYPDLLKDYDGETRPAPAGTMPDIGADEIIQ